MAQFNFENLFSISQNHPQHSVSAHELKAWQSKYPQYREAVLSRNQGFLDLPGQDVQVYLDYAKKVKGKFQDIVILGIGGSMLGPLCLIDALYSPFAQPRVHCLDNIDPYKMAELTRNLNLSTTLFLVQTKSGTTPETLAQYFYFKDLYAQAGLSDKEHFVFVTDPTQGYLRKVADTQGYTSFEIPANVGGRFSVLSSVGLVIGVLIGIDIKKLLEGAAHAKRTYFELSNHDVFQFAATQYSLFQKGKNIHVIMPYSSRLRTLASWYVQLLSESIGKEFNLKNEVVNTGPTPLPALGATDQHSQLQLFKEGPYDKYMIFLEVLDHQVTVPIPNPESEPSLAYLSDKSINDLLYAEFVGTRQSLTESNRPNITLTIEKVDEFNVGCLFMIFELATAILGEMLEIDTFNQPGVERSKVLAREVLAKLD